MNVALLCCCLSATPAAEVKPLVLLAEEAVYQKAKEKEISFDGILERNAGGKLGPAGRFNVYRLATEESGKATTHDLYVPGKAALLALYVGKRVRILGKLVETEDDGKKYVELWPARLEISGGALPEAPGKDGVFARSGWQPPEAQRVGSRHYVFRDGEALAKGMKLTGASPAEGATAELARGMRITAVDWKKHMAVSVCAGLTSGGATLRVTRAAVEDGTLFVRYLLETPKSPTDGFGYPAETVLLPRFDGPVKVEIDKAKSE
jgi:hypothetical protein